VQAYAVFRGREPAAPRARMAPAEATAIEVRKSTFKGLLRREHRGIAFNRHFGHGGRDRLPARPRARLRGLARIQNSNCGMSHPQSIRQRQAGINRQPD
jgi:hypothetical protein